MKSGRPAARAFVAASLPFWIFSLSGSALYTWAVAPGIWSPRPQGDGPEKGGRAPASAVTLEPPDPRVPLGGTDFASSHRIVLVDATRIRPRRRRPGR